jgi:hypothetical protein
MRLIDADKALEQINEWLDQTGAIPLNTSYHFELLGCIEDCPTIDAVPVVCGEWKRGREFSSYPRVPFIGDAYYCSNCEEEAYWDTDYGQQLFGFCPNCGAKMEVEP